MNLFLMKCVVMFNKKPIFCNDSVITNYGEHRSQPKSPCVELIFVRDFYWQTYYYQCTSKVCSTITM